MANVPPTTEWPVELRRYLAHLAMQRLLENHGGYAGLMEWLSYGQFVDGNRVPFGTSIEVLYPMFLKNAEEWHANRQRPS